ncbi:hypothetical protein TSAR_002341 [Trichomalopsis sarcophagae]|uniref:Uncharacterized protein n=1 Tax=Trichomalopsis sarcophagae TaxID=543379 RepID=A0A232EKG1_9HYME|nr:hypothetical protein TSAR_002341 [Trichomalopsis sarcophagae]
MRGIRTVGGKIKKEIKNVLKEKLNAEIYIKKRGLALQLESMENKIKIMRKKNLLRRLNLWLEDDLTDREREIQVWLEKIIRRKEKGA